MFDDLKIRNKLILLMAGPIVIILLLSTMGARSRQSSASESRSVEALVSVSRANSDVADALQQESLYSSGFLGSNRTAWAKELKAARTNTDTVLALALPRLKNGLGGSSSTVGSTAELAVGAADKLGYFRDSVDQGFRRSQINELVVDYRDIQNTFLAVNTSVADAMTDPKAASELRGAAALGTYKSALATQGSVLAGAAEAGSFGTTETVSVFQKALDAEKSQLALLSSIAGLGRKGEVRDALATDSGDSFTFIVGEAKGLESKDQLDIDGKTVTSSAGTVLKDLHTVETNLFQNLIADSQAARSSAERASNLFLVAAIVAILGAAAAAVLLGRRITKPLGRLTEAADWLSQEQMPRLIETLKNPAEDEMGFQIGSMRPIEIDSGDEIGRLARSFNEVQRVAGEVAAEQASLLRKGIGEMFVNLARRNQALLDRQIEFIDELERGEEDPDQLDNLYKLDHLATRMRRNAESLLVLAGAEPPRRRGRPAPLANVVRAALAEVEDFGRIELLSFDEVLVASNAAADLAHLLSELMENATNFSPPETRVEVVGHKTKADGYVISVTDHGIGMSGEQIVEANESLAKPPLVGLAMSRSLGFIVVGRLAARHGIAVRMMPSAAGGVTAVVSIPPSLVVDTPGGMIEPEPMVEAPARLKPVLDSPTTGLAPLSFSASEAAPAAAPSAPAPVPAAAAVAEPSSMPAPAAFAPPEDDKAPALAFAPPPDAAPKSPTSAPAPVAWGPDPTETADDGPSRPTHSIFDDPAIAPPAAAAADAALAAEVDEAVAPAMPAALSFDAPPLGAPEPPLEASTPVPPSVQANGSAHLDGPAPRAPQTSRPFFLEDAEPPRPFGLAPDGHQAAAPAPAAPAPTAPRLFGGPPAPAPAPAVEPTAPAAPAPSGLTARRPGATAPPSVVATPPAAPTPPAVPAAAPATEAPAPVAPAAAASAAPAAPTEAAESAAPVKTSAGLAKRVPRSAGATRAIPGSEVERGVSATRRSPEEIRNMLSQHSAGRQRARVQESVSAGAPDERDSHE